MPDHGDLIDISNVRRALRALADRHVRQSDVYRELNVAADHVTAAMKKLAEADLQGMIHTDAEAERARRQRGRAR